MNRPSAASGRHGTVVAIHQPNFFPWLGYFDKIARSDVFVFLDSVQASKTGGSWLNRVKLAMNGEARWVTAPIDRQFQGVRPVNEIQFASTQWRQQLLKTLASAYGRAPHYVETMGLIEPLVLNPDNHLAAFNHTAVMAIVKRLGLDQRRFVLSSTLELEPDATANDLLVAITKAVGGDIYLCGGGSTEYFDERVFAQNVVAVRYQNFSHPLYSQAAGEPMLPGLSVVDALMHCGTREVGRWWTTAGA